MQNAAEQEADGGRKKERREKVRTAMAVLLEKPVSDQANVTRAKAPALHIGKLQVGWLASSLIGPL